MADYERRYSGPPRGGRKRRYRGQYTNVNGGFLSVILLAVCSCFLTDDDDYDRRPQRRRYEEPLVARIRRLLFTIAESVRLPYIYTIGRLETLRLYDTDGWFVGLGCQKDRGRCRVHREDCSGELRG